MAQDEKRPPVTAVEDAAVYTEHEAGALSLAAELRDRVQRERAVVANLQAYLSGERTPPDATD